MKNLKLFLTLTVLINCANLFSQESIVFDKQYLFDGRNNYIKDFKQTPDGGFICGGLIAFEMFDSRFLLFKTDSLGEVEWYKYQDSVSVNSDLWAVDITKTGNYVGFGITQENPDWHQSGAIVMFDETGDTLWSKQYAFASPDDSNVKSKVTFSDGLYTKDNELVAAGCINEDERGTNPLVVKTNLDGDTIWTWRLYDTNNIITLRAIAETNDGHFVAVGIAEDSVFINTREYSRRRGIIVKLNSEGELQLFYEWTDLPDCGFECFTIDNFGNYLIGGFNYKHWPDVEDSEYYGLVIKTDTLGNTIWKKNVSYAVDISCLDIDCNSQNEIICLNLIEPPYSENWKMDAILEKYSSQGELVWSKIIGEQTVINWPYAVTTTYGDGIAFCGLYSPNSDPSTSWIVKTDSAGNGNYNTGWINAIYDNQLANEVIMYPNPANDFVTINTNTLGESVEVSIYDTYGQLIQKINFTDQNIIVPVRHLQDGLYIIKIENNSVVYTGKLQVKH
jgi:hypothetical protein